MMTQGSKLMLLLLLVVGVVQGQLGLDVEEANAVIATATDAFTQMSEIMTSGAPGRLLATVGKTLAMLGPAMMAVSAVLSIIQMFLPQQDSAELIAIREGFEEVNRKLDSLSDDVKNLESVVKLSAAKSAYAKTLTVINENYENFKTALTSNDTEAYRYFKINYENTYGMSANHLYDAMMGSNGAFGFNMVQLYSDTVKCNPYSIAKFCTMGIHTINRGLACEGTYFGMQNFTAQVKARKKAWVNKLQALTDQCVALVHDCESKWEQTSNAEFVAAYNKHVKSSNDVLAEQLIIAVSSAVPQRAWLAVAYNDAGGFGQHTYSTYSNYKTFKIWNKNNKDVTVFSVEKTKVKKSQVRKWQASMTQKYKEHFHSAKYCKNNGWGNQNSGNQSRAQVNIIREFFFAGVVYFVDARKSPGMRYSYGRLLSELVPYNCVREKYLMIMFQ